MARVLTATGSWAFTIALALYAYYEDGIGGVAVALAVRALPAALAAPHARALAQRVPSNAYVAASAALRALALAAIAVGVGVDMPFWAILALVALFRIAGAAEADGRRYEEVGLLLGAAAAGICMTLATLHTVFALSAVIFAAAAVAALAAPGTWLVFAQAGPAARPIQIARVLRGGSRATVEVLVVVAAVDLVGVTDQGVAWLYGGWAVGMLAGARVVASGRETSAAAGSLLAGAAIALLAIGPAPLGAFVLLVAVGVGFALAPWAGLGGGDTVEALARTLGAAAAAGLVAVVGDTTALVVAGSALTTLGLAATARRVSVSAPAG